MANEKGTASNLLGRFLRYTIEDQVALLAIVLRFFRVLVMSFKIVAA